MSIVATEATVIGDKVWYRCQDSGGAWYEYGPLNEVSPSFDVEGYKTVVAAKVQARLSANEIEDLLNG